MFLPRMVGAVAACAAVVLASAASAWAGTPLTWGPSTALPAGTTSLGDQVLSSPTGALLRYSVKDRYPTLEAFGPDGLGAAVRIPGAPQDAVPGPVSFLPDGSAVISYYRFNSGPLQLIVRLADGTFGPIYNAGSGAESFAARAGEVLVLGSAFFNVQQVTALSLSIAADGTLTPVGSPGVIYSAPSSAVDKYGTQIDVPVVALDADAGAEAVFHVDHVETSGNEIVDIHRTPAGAWGTPVNLAAGLQNATFVGMRGSAVAPGGRALIALETGDGSLTKSTLFESLREPGGGFGAPTPVNDIAAPGGAINTTKVAAGGDGTLALAVYALTCQTTSTSEVKHETLTALVAPPGKGLGSYGVDVLDSAGGHSSLKSLGAGAGQAIVGLNDQQTTAGNPDNVCGLWDLSGDGGTIGDRAALVGAGGTADHTFGSGTFAQNGNGSVALAVDAAGIDPAGDAAVTGRLATSGVPAYTYYTGPPPPVVEPSVTPTPDATTPAATSAPATTPPVKSPPAPVNTGSPTPSTGPVTLDSSGTVSVTLTAPALGPGDTLGEQIAIQVFSGAARVASVKSKLIGTVKKTVKLESKQKLVVHLKLTSKLRTYLKKHPKAGVALQLASTQKGHPTTVKTKAVKLKKR
jgi:hypothetical protein